MARVKLPDELKKAISGLSHKEKDKLLFRLIAKEPFEGPLEVQVRSTTIHLGRELALRVRVVED